MIRDAPALGLNVLTRTDVADYLIDGTGETGVLFQGAVNSHTADGSTIRNVTMRRIGEFNSVAYGKHGIYGKATGLVGENIDMSLSQYCADGLSARFPSTWRKFKITGQHQHAITYYETGSVKGNVLFEDFDGTFNSPDAAVWVDRESNYQQFVVADFTFRRVALAGPSAWFFATYDSVFKGTVRLEGCTLNGAPVTTGNVRGVAPGSLVIV